MTIAKINSDLRAGAGEEITTGADAQPGHPGSREHSLPQTKKAALRRFFHDGDYCRLFALCLGGESLHEVHQLATDLRIGNFDEGTVKLQPFRGRQEIDHVVGA